MIKAVLFDMDGVLFDSERLGRDIFVRECEARGYHGSRELYPRLLGCTPEADAAITRAQYGPDFPIEEILRIFRRDLGAITEKGEMPTKEGAAECTARLAEMGLPCAIATGSGTRHVEQYLAHEPALQGRFAAIISADMVEHSKPHPEIYLKAAAALGVEPCECVGVEDSLNGVKALRAAGAHVVMVPDLVPYGPDHVPYVDTVLTTLKELPDLIARLNAK